MLSALLLVAAVTASATPVARTAYALRVATPPVIDGDLSDSAWVGAPRADGFTQLWPDSGRPPVGPTEVRIVYDDQAVYFAFHCFDPDPRNIVDRLTRRDYDSASDSVIVDIDTSSDHSRAFHFEVSAAGVIRDAIRTGRRAVAYDWDAVWKAAARRTPDGWTAEMAIPFAALRYAHVPHAEWRLQLKRYLSRRNETDQWVFIPLTVQTEMPFYGLLDGLDGLPQVHGIVLNPFVAGRLRWQYAPPTIVAPNGFDTIGTVGLDAQIALTSRLTLQTTILPDFGQVEADPAVQNLTHFEVHLDEKRQFFLQGADYFQLADYGGNALTNQLFYSRRLGAAPPVPYVPTGATLVSTPDVTPIWGAAKLTGQVGKVSVALLDAVGAQDNALLRLSDGTLVNEETAPLTNFLVGRLRAPVAAGTTVGVSVTDVARQESRDQIGYGGIGGICPDGNPRGSDGRCTNDAQAVAADLLWQPADGNYAATALLMGSRVGGAHQNIMPDGTVISSGDLGLGARVQLAKTSGNLSGYMSFETASPKLDLNDAGYQPQQNYRTYGGDIAYRVYNLGPVLSNNTHLALWETDAWQGVLLGRRFSVSNGANFRDQWYLGASFGGGEEAYDIRETGDGTPYQRPGGWWGSIWGGANSTRPISGGGWASAHTNWRGYGAGGGVWFDAKVLRRLELYLEPSASWNTGDPRYVETLSDAPGGQYLFGLQDAFSMSTTFRTTLTFTPTVTLETYAQLFFSAIRYDTLFSATADPDILLANLTPVAGDSHAFDSRDPVLNVSVVFRWEYLPGSALYLVYTHSQDGSALPLQTNPDGTYVPARSFDVNALAHGQSEDVLLAKVSYYWGG